MKHCSYSINLIEQVGFAYWPLLQLVNFRFMPTQFKPAFVGVAAFVWTNFLCYQKSRKSKKQETVLPVEESKPTFQVIVNQQNLGIRKM